jgi:5-methylcytosine-specific restriction protein A
MSEPRAFQDVVTGPEQLMGVKAVFGVLTGRAMCFGSRGDARLKDRGYFQSARVSAEYAAERPMLVTIGGGADCQPGIEGRVLNVAKVSKVYGETPVFYKDPVDLERLARWPVATALLDVYEVEGQPRLVEDLGLPDRTILTNAFDLVVRPENKVEALWEALRDVPLHLADLPPLVNFREPDRVTLVGSIPPMRISREEGRFLVKEVQEYERRSDLAKLARATNRDANGGVLVCEACGFSDELDGMFDVHHLVPLMLGVRETTPSDLAVLCPLCHRWAHRKGDGQTNPLPMIELVKARRTQPD